MTGQRVGSPLTGRQSPEGWLSLLSQATMALLLASVMPDMHTLHRAPHAACITSSSSSSSSRCCRLQD